MNHVPKGDTFFSNHSILFTQVVIMVNIWNSPVSADETHHYDLLKDSV